MNNLIIETDLAEILGKINQKIDKLSEELTGSKDITELTKQQKGKLKQILEQVIAINPHSGKALKGLNSYRLNRKDRILPEIYERD